MRCDKLIQLPPQNLALSSSWTFLLPQRQEVGIHRCPLQGGPSSCELTALHLLQDINKRLSLPADIRLPDGYLEKFNLIGPALFEQPISRRLRRVSLVGLRSDTMIT